MSKHYERTFGSHRVSRGRRQLWSEQEIATAAAIYRQLIVTHGHHHGVYALIDREVAAALGRDVRGATGRRINFGPTYGKGTGGARVDQSFRVPETVLREREERQAAADLRTLTATFCGDPPPGYSALDRRGRP